MRFLTSSFTSKVIQSTLIVSCLALAASAHATTPPVPDWTLVSPPIPTPPVLSSKFNQESQLFSGSKSLFNATAGSTASVFNTLATRFNGKVIPPYLDRVDAITGRAAVTVSGQATNIFSYLRFSSHQTPSAAGTTPAVSNVTAIRLIIKLNRSYVGDLLSWDPKQYPIVASKPDQSNRARVAELFLDAYLPGFRKGLSLYNVSTDGFSVASASGSKVIAVGPYSQVKAKITVTNNSGNIEIASLYSFAGKGDISPLSDEVQLAIFLAEAQLEGLH